MFNQYFGHYLLNKGFLTPDQLFQSLQNERSARVRLGTLAVDAGLLTGKQAEELHDLQRAKDKKFGELALEQGYLTAAQVDRLLAAQGQGHLALVQAITDNGYLTLTAIEKALADFRQEYGITGDSPLTADDAELNRLLDFSRAGDKAPLLYSYAGLTLRNIVRFLNDTPFLLPQTAQASAAGCWVASQQLTGDPAVKIDLIMDEQTVLATAGRFSGETLTSVDELALDSIGEFLNVHNGVFGSLLSDKGFKVDLQPQTIQRQEPAPDGAGYRLAINTSLGRFDFIIAVQ
ncbi:hypothetical protein [Sporomusa termitida]|uniref:Chemotaxis phosphatase CheX-like domain-containing protein n=1 Tax=Sporomusa termitida TaxID=2377 RepID=A0A517DZ56_9FIRM|nr:hypothetical protein [Sporomusa termitida]QDR82598.1 hypothetical protein SPTER_40260 [Sporomusa termitida]